MYFKKMQRSMAENMQASRVRTDAKQALKHRPAEAGRGILWQGAKPAGLPQHGIRSRRKTDLSRTDFYDILDPFRTGGGASRPNRRR